MDGYTYQQARTCYVHRYIVYLSSTEQIRIELDLQLAYNKLNMCVTESGESRPSE
jgi:hypothetical protein